MLIVRIPYYICAIVKLKFINRMEKIKQYPYANVKLSPLSMDDSSILERPHYLYWEVNASSP